MQLAGGLLTFIIGHFFITAHPSTASSWSVVWGEFTGAAILGFGIASTFYQRLPSAIKGGVIGGSLLLGLLIATPFSNAILNPAIALGIGSFTFLYILSPIAGVIGGMQLVKLLHSKITEEK